MPSFGYADQLRDHASQIKHTLDVSRSEIYHSTIPKRKNLQNDSIGLRPIRIIL